MYHFSLSAVIIVSVTLLSRGSFDADAAATTTTTAAPKAEAEAKPHPKPAAGTKASNAVYECFVCADCAKPPPRNMTQKNCKQCSKVEAEASGKKTVARLCLSNLGETNKCVEKKEVETCNCQGNLCNEGRMLHASWITAVALVSFAVLLRVDASM